jgi:hypothetical protein
VAPREPPSVSHSEARQASLQLDVESGTSAAGPVLAFRGWWLHAVLELIATMLLVNQASLGGKGRACGYKSGLRQCHGVEEPLR